MGKTIFSGVLALTLVATFAAGCAQQQQRPTVLMQSDTLVEQLAIVLGESMAARQESGATLPADYDSSEFAESVIDSMLMQHPEAFTVTLDEERRLREGELDDEANAEAAAAMVAQLRDSNASFNTITEYLVERLEAGELSGLQLELTNRLLAAHLSTQLVAEEPA